MCKDEGMKTVESSNMIKTVLIFEKTIVGLVASAAPRGNTAEIIPNIYTMMFLL